MCCTNRSGKLFISENGLEVMWIDSSIVTISLFWVDVPTSSQRVRFSIQMTRTEADDKVKLREEFRPTSLLTSKDLGSGEVLQVLVVSDNVDRKGGTLKVVSPNLKSIENSKKLLVMSVVV